MLEENEIYHAIIDYWRWLSASFVSWVIHGSACDPRSFDALNGHLDVVNHVFVPPRDRECIIYP